MYVLYFKLIYILALLHSYDVKIKPLYHNYDRLIHKKIFLDLSHRWPGIFSMIKTGERNNRGCYGNTFCTMLYGYSIGIWLQGILLLWKSDREFTDISLHC